MFSVWGLLTHTPPGAYDWICNWAGNKAMTEDLQWHGQSEYRSRELREWFVPGSSEAAGLTKSFGKLTFASVYAAGHMASRVFSSS